MIEVRFGYLQEPTVIDWSLGSIKPLDNITSIVERLQIDGNAYGDWFYPPLEPAPHAPKEIKNAPLIQTEIFSLPSTHLLSFNKQDDTDECANFMIALFGMLKGRRLQREGWQHFYKAPIAPMPGCDFIAYKRGIAYALEKASEFWLKHSNTETRKLVFGVLHWHIFAQLYQHNFERFNAQYMALDACHKLATETWAGFIPAKQHCNRASELCMQLGVPIPAWAEPFKKSCALATRRNSLAHEAMYGGEPVGFAMPTEHKGMEFELTLLVVRLLLRVLGIDNEYTRSACTTYQQWGFDSD